MSVLTAIWTFIDPTFWTNFWPALIALMVAATAALNQYNARKGKEMGELNQRTTEDAAKAAAQAVAVAQTAVMTAQQTSNVVVQHNTTAVAKLDTIQNTVNGATEELKTKIADQAAQITDQVKEIATLKAENGHINSGGKTQ